MIDLNKAIDQLLAKKITPAEYVAIVREQTKEQADAERLTQEDE